LNPNARRANEVLAELSNVPPTSQEYEALISEELPDKTPEPDSVGSDEIELLAETTSASEFETQDDAQHGEEATDGGAVSSEYEDYTLETEDSSALVGGSSFNDDAQQGTAPQADNAMPSDSDDAFLADLEQVDFFIEQGLIDEATTMLDELERKAPGHMLIADRREKVAGFGHDAATSQGAVPALAHGSTGSTARKSAVPSELPHEVSGASRGDHDADTLVDLGIMEKTMERYEAAISHFRAATTDPKREVFALSMIGECHEALGDSAEAIRCYQDALKRPTATPAEATQLYFQLGNVFYNLGDNSEALYYFERVLKRDPNFRDITRKLAEVKAHAASR
jgi:tetratricopeptide (TPR) repeat protein